MMQKTIAIVVGVVVYLAVAVATYEVARAYPMPVEVAAVTGALWPVFWLEVAANSGGR